MKADSSSRAQCAQLRRDWLKLMSGVNARITEPAVFDLRAIVTAVSGKEC